MRWRAGRQAGDACGKGDRKVQRALHTNIRCRCPLAKLWSISARGNGVAAVVQRLSRQGEVGFPVGRGPVGKKRAGRSRNAYLNEYSSK